MLSKASLKLIDQRINELIPDLQFHNIPENSDDHLMLVITPRIRHIVETVAYLGDEDVFLDDNLIDHLDSLIRQKSLDVLEFMRPGQ